MRQTLHILLVALLLGALPVAVSATTEGSLELGGWGASEDGSPDVVTKYESTDSSPSFLLDLESMDNWGALDLDAEVLNQDTRTIEFIIDVHRWFRSRTESTRFLHRLGHKPLDHFESATNHGRVVRHTDLDPSRVYEITYELFEHRSEFQPTGFDALTFAIGYRRQERDGIKQITEVSHCDNCHVVSKSRSVDEVTEDGGLEAQFAWKTGQIRASFVRRDLENGQLSTSFLYDDALHPENRKPVFDNRVQFDSAEGPLAIDLTPNVTKDFFRLDGTFANLGGFIVNAEGVWTETENEYTGLKADYSGFLVTAARKLGKSWDLRWRGRSFKIDNDDVFVEVNKRVGVAGPQAGGTYYDFYPDAPGDFLRQSTLNRDVTESKFDLVYRIGKKGGRFRGFWNYESVDREHYQVAVDKTKTTTNLYGLSWSARPAKRWKTNLRWKHGDVKNPYGNLNGQYSTLVSPASPSGTPFDPLSAQYFEFHRERIADVTALPAKYDEVEVRASYGKARSMFTGTYRWWDGENKEGDLADWAKNTQAATLTYWATPSPKWQWHASYAWNATETDMPASIPLFDG